MLEELGISDLLMFGSMKTLTNPLSEMLMKNPDLPKLLNVLDKGVMPKKLLTGPPKMELIPYLTEETVYKFPLLD